MTRQRQVIFEEVKSGCHPTADQIYERVRKRMPQISMGTVYRNLDTLASLGLISKMQPDHTQMRFDFNTTEHYHTTCMNCGRVDDFPIEPTDNTLENLEKALGKLTKYGIFGHRLEFISLCPECSEKEEEFLLEEKNKIAKKGGVKLWN
jgi:Fur family ferric uptake transcriptional regulator